MDIDSLIPYLLHLIVLHVSVAVGAIYLVYKYKSAAGNLPPGRKGLPYAGETLEFASASRSGCPEKFIRERSGKYSADVFRTSLLGEDMAIFCGAAGNKFLFTSQNKYVTSWWPKGLVKPFMGDFDNQQDQAAKLHLPSVLPLLKPDSLKQYTPIMDMMAKEHLHKYWWSPNPNPNNEQQVIQVFPLSKKYTFALACRLFMSVEDEQEVENLATPFVLATAGLVSVPIDLPGTTFHRAIKAGRLTRQQLLALVTNKKNELLAVNGRQRQTDLVDSMLMEGLPEIEVVKILIALFVASYDTTSAVLTFTISYLSDYPHIYNRVLQEHKDIVRSKEVGEALTWEDIQKMKYTWCVVCEAMRLTPPAYGAFREAKTDFTFAGYTIPKGWKVS
ncbi:Cytochrome P450 [Corchorus capsularis]|uniref:Cytochrome P450 n=1 Tax=Corchorus capsularis TaxID=210143 RepID=A0A1R3KZ35_COCAP|nr:Cytochrome P450 [Corchorus capsularis]